MGLCCSHGTHIQEKDSEEVINAQSLHDVTIDLQPTASVWSCTTCKFDNEQTYEFCGECGAPREKKDVWSCTACKFDNEQTKKFCGKCGAPREKNVWSCTACKFDNEQTKKFCGKCGASREKNVWSCTACKFDNEQTKKFCGKCGAPREKNGWSCTSCNIVNQEESKFCGGCGKTKESNRGPTEKPPDSSSQGVNHIASDTICSNERRIVLIGKTGSGKSAAGNSILGSYCFESHVHGESITKECTQREATRFGKKLMVVDTPGLFDTNMTNEIMTKEIVKCIFMTLPGPHAFILVVPIGRFTKEEQDTVNHFVGIFGKEMFRYLIVLFTRKDDILKDGITIEQYVSTLPKDLKEVLNKCGNQYFAIDNTSSNEIKDADIKTLLNHIEQILQGNNGCCYTNEMYLKAERDLKRQMDEIEEKEEEKKNSKLREIKENMSQQFQHELEKLSAEKEIHKKNLEMLLEKQQDTIDKLQEEVKKQKENKELEQKLDQFKEDLKKEQEIENLRKKVDTIEEAERQAKADMEKKSEELEKQVKEDCESKIETLKNQMKGGESSFLKVAMDVTEVVSEATNTVWSKIFG